MSQTVASTPPVITTTPANKYGKTPSASVSEAMDVDKRPLATTDQNDTMTSKPLNPASQTPPSPPPLLVINAEAPNSIDPQPVLERPRQDNEGETSSQAAQCTTAHEPPQFSHLSTNLLSVFKLDPLIASVARFDPTTGEKINKMRKSYEGQIKALGLAGKNKSIKHEEALAAGAGKMASLKELSSWPEEEWQNQKVYGKDIKKGLPEHMKAKLEKAFSLNPGPVPDGSKWEDILGIDRPNPAANHKIQKDAKINGKSASAAAHTTTNAAAGASDHIRARRNTKKRRYDDGSFEGYGEGFVDDEMEVDGYESGETYTSKNSRGSRGEKIKRRKTNEYGKTAGGGGGSRTGSFASGYGR